MKVTPYSCNYYISKLSIDSMLHGKVKKNLLIKCLKNVSNSYTKSSRLDIAPHISNIKSILHERGSGILDKKKKLLDEIISCSVNRSERSNELQACISEMKSKRSLWSKDFGLKINHR